MITEYLIMDLYSLEFFIEKLEVGSPNKVKAVDLQVFLKCSDFINIQIQYFVKASAYNLRKLGFGKAIVFSSTRMKVIVGFTSDFRASVSETETPEITVGTAKITWPRDFDSRVKELDKNNDHIQHKGVFNVINKESKTVGTMQVKMCLIYYGGAIEVPIHELGSALSIPLSFRIKMKQENEEWAPMFLAPKKPTKSLMDPSMVFYAQMAGIEPQPPMSALLTPEYINKRLCGHEGCPGAEGFKKFGLGPLATEGSCLGTIQSIKNSKPCGVYGMSQAYGTMDNYGAYGLFVKKPTKPKRVCGSPDCPYTIYFGNPEVSSNVVVEEIPKTCQCKNCRKNVDSDSSTGSSSCKSPKCPKSAPKINSNVCPESTRKVESTCGSINCLYSTPNVDNNTCEAANCAYNNPRSGSTCGNPNCPKSTPKTGVTCPYLNKSRLSAGADKYSSECPQTCPYSTSQKQKRQTSTPTSRGSCGGWVCPLLPGNYEDPLTAMDGFDKESFYGESDNSKEILEEAKNCADKSCPFYVEKKNCKDKSCRFYEESDDEYDIGPCGGRVCPLDKQAGIVSSPEDIFGPYPKKDTKSKRYSLLIDEDGKQILLSADKGDNETINYKNLPAKSKELLSTLSPADNSDIFLLISRLAAERKQTNSLKNDFPPDPAVSTVDSTEKKDQSGSCGKDSCKFLKYKTCSECGGVSRTGATCDNTDVSFSTISYDSITTTPVPMAKGVESAKPLGKKVVKPAENFSENVSGKTAVKTPEKSKTAIKPAVAKKKSDSAKNLRVKIAKERRKNSRFAYIGGEFYPGIILGHKTCVVGARNVPARMGWKWNVKNEGEQKKKKGWKPGVMYKVVEQRIIENRRAKGIPDPPELKMLVKKIKFQGYEVESESEEEEVEPKPTLLIEKKEGNYLITMNPLKDPKTLVPRENPYMRCKPMQFLIVKPKKEPPLVPINSGSQEYEGEGEGEEDFDHFYNPCNCDADSKVLDSSSSSESELNIEFTTPAGLINPEDMKRPPNVVNVFTQFLQADFNCEDCAIIIPKKFTKDKKKKGKR